MLTQWTLGNFKSVADETTLELKPITVLAGANSSGKSTVLQSILAISQTLKATPGEHPLVYNGEFTRLGYYYDIAHNQMTDRPIVFGFKLISTEGKGAKASTPSQISPLSVRIAIHARTDSLYEERPRYSRLGYVEIVWGTSKQRVYITELQAKDDRLYRRFRMPPELEAEFEAGKYGYVIQDSTLWHRVVESVRPLVRMNHFLPSSILETYDAVMFQARNNYLDIITLLREGDGGADLPVGRKQEIVQMLNKDAPENEFLKKYIRSLLHQGTTSSTQASAYYLEKRKSADRLAGTRRLGDAVLSILRNVPLPYRKRMASELQPKVEGIKLRLKSIPSGQVGVRLGELPGPLHDAIDAMTQFFAHRIYYLGPLRKEPQFIYSLPPFPDLTHVGLQGEFTAPVLERFKGEQIDYPLPPDEIRKGRQVEHGPLIHAVQSWLRYMGLLEKVTTKDRGKMGTELTVRTEGVHYELDLTSIGVGVSQALPTLVMGLIAPKGTTLLLEQPELHLHPRVQSRLADFLMGLTRVGKQCIVETHSEYLINRLRRRVAEDETDALARNIQIYFVEREKGKTHFRKVDMNDFGAILEWPRGFFDEGPREADLIMKAAMKKRRAKMAEKKER